jgi:hypothetical protein
MKNALTRVLSTLAIAIAVASAAPASAASGLITGTVARIKIQSTSTGTSFFALKSSATVGQCTVDNGNTLALFPDDDRGKAMLSVVTAALLSGKSLTVMLDDTDTQSGWGVLYCWAQYVQLSP